MKRGRAMMLLSVLLAAGAAAFAVAVSLFLRTLGAPTTPAPVAETVPLLGARAEVDRASREVADVLHRTVAETGAVDGSATETELRRGVETLDRLILGVESALASPRRSSAETEPSPARAGENT